MYVKSRLVTDIINLVKKKRETVAGLDEFESLSRIHPADMENPEYGDETNWVYPTILQLKELFYSLTTFKNKTQISAQMFEKLMNKKVIARSGMI